MSKANESVLVVEDDAALREALVDTLHAAGLPALAAADAPGALQLLQNEEIALVISDVQMPGPIDGAGVALLMREQRPDMPIVVTSGHGIPTPLPTGGRFVAKPYDNRKVVSLLTDLLAA